MCPRASVTVRVDVEDANDDVMLRSPSTGIGLGALIAYAGRADQRPSGVITRR